jgi:quinol monooxygenase YgiN
MSVIMTARLIRNSRRVRGRSRAEPLLSRTVAAASRDCGCLKRSLIATADEALLFEEWSDTDAFETFFDGTPDYRRAIDEAGFRGFPDDIKLWRQTG